MVRVGLIFHSLSNDNFGVGALSISEVEILRRVSCDRGVALELLFLAGAEARPAYIHGSDISLRLVRPLRRPFDFYRAVRSCDLIVDIGGGDSFTDIYGRRRFLQVLFMKLIVHAAFRPLVLAPQTYGPFGSFFSAIFARLTVRASAIVCSRDLYSVQYLKELGVRRHVIEASDVALRLPFCASSSDSDTGKVKIGINISGLLMRGGYSGDNMFGLRVDYPSLMREIIARFQGLPVLCEVHLVPHVIDWNAGGVEDDFAACLLLAEEFQDVLVPPAFSSPTEAKSYIAGMDFFLGARMHACIAAFSTGVPVVPMAYSRKFAGLFGTLGYHETVDCTLLSAEDIILRIFDAFERRVEIVTAQSSAFDLGLSKLERYETALGDLIEKIAEEL